MLENCKNARERWGGVNELIDRWLHERQEFLVQYCELAAHGAYDANNPNFSTQVRRMCQTLMDYVSAGHFEIYEQLLKEAEEFDDGSEKLANEIYPELIDHTQQVLAFNDKFDTDEHCEEKRGDFPLDLAELGQGLESRFELEDRLIEVLHNSHKDMV